jgi:hypothetical protein
MRRLTLGIVLVLVLSSVHVFGDGKWSPLLTPGQRDWGAAVYDPVSHRMVLFGGEHHSGYYGDVWALELTEGDEFWYEVEASGASPSERRSHTAIYDPVNHRMIVFGGSGTSGYYNDVHELSLGEGSETWSELTTSGTPPPVRRGHAAVYDPVNHRMIVFGGIYSSTFMNDVWSLDLTTLEWSELFPAGSSPLPRRSHRAVYDPVEHRMLTYGGGLEIDFGDDLWELSLDLGSETWTRLYPSGYTPYRSSYGMIYDEEGNRIFMHGGYDWYGIYSDVLLLDLNLMVMTSLTVEGISPCWCRNQSVVYDSTADRMIAFGGDVGGAYYASTYALQLPPISVSESGETSRLASYRLIARPNPASSNILIQFETRGPGVVTVDIYDVTGRQIEVLQTSVRKAGRHEVFWNLKDHDGERVPAGTYFYRVNTAEGIQTGKIAVRQ